MPTTRYELEFEDTFDGDDLDDTRWIRHHLPHWSTSERSVARHAVESGHLRLRIDADQEPWCPELDGSTRVSSLQTGVFSGPAGSTIGQHRFNPDALVRTGLLDTRLYTPRYGYFEVRAKAIDDPRCMVAFWVIGFEDEPSRSAEICICEIFERDVEPDRAIVGIGVHPFGDPQITDDFTRETVSIDAREFHLYRAAWLPDHVTFYIDGEPVRSIQQSPSYPMQFMLGIYEFGDGLGAETPASSYPKEFAVDYVRGYRIAD